MNTTVGHSRLLTVPSQPQTDRSSWFIQLRARLVVALFWLATAVLTAEAGQRAGQYVTPNDPLIATTESCAAQQDEFNRLAAQAKEPALSCWKKNNQGTPVKDRRLSSQCMQWWNSSATYHCSVAPSCVGLTETYYWLRIQQDEARPRCHARAAQQRALKEAAENALGTERSADRQFQMDVNKQVRDVGQEILEDMPLQARVFDHAMAAIGLSNDQVLRQMEFAFSGASLNPGGPTAADYSRLKGAISRAGESAADAARAEDLLNELFEEFKRRNPNSLVTEAAENPWVRALFLARDMVGLYRDHKEALRVAEGSGVPPRPTAIATPPPAPLRPPAPTTVTPVPTERVVGAPARAPTQAEEAPLDDHTMRRFLYAIGIAEMLENTGKSGRSIDDARAMRDNRKPPGRVELERMISDLERLAGQDDLTRKMLADLKEFVKTMK